MASREQNIDVLECHECGWSVTRDQLPISRCPKCGCYSFEPIERPPGVRTYTEVVEEYRRLHPNDRMSRALACRLGVGFIDKLIRQLAHHGMSAALGITSESEFVEPLPRIRRQDCIGQIRLF